MDYWMDDNIWKGELVEYTGQEPYYLCHCCGWMQKILLSDTTEDTELYKKSRCYRCNCSNLQVMNC
jgi:hypothetical protein